MNKQIVQYILNKPAKLSDDQCSAVITTSRFSRIIAGAGAGKTETLTRRIAYLLLIKNVPPSSIVAFTFTEKAAQSMKNRIYERIGQIGGEEATANLGEMHIGTIHGYAKRILEDHFGLGNYVYC
jgi:DNA helicase-2/ATP-dependent DNA helicase PcrA